MNKTELHRWQHQHKFNGGVGHATSFGIHEQVVHVTIEVNSCSAEVHS